ncbi:MAG: hypothetical protein WC716_14570 [Chitinophagaceae bacterium]|jgi:hypothetical protein
MHKLLETPESAHWNSPLLHDLSFIKKHLRYPVNKRTIWPMLWMAAMSLFILFYAGMIVLFNEDRIAEKGFTFQALLPYFVAGIVCLVLLLAVIRRIKSFRFISIKSDFVVNENIKLVRQFLQRQNIAFFHNPDAPEVFQISSRVLDIQTGNREIMVFIADDKRILLNSHFTSTNGDRGMKEVSTGAHRQMAKNLKKWLKENEYQYPGASIKIS